MYFNTTHVTPDRLFAAPDVGPIVPLICRTLDVLSRHYSFAHELIGPMTSALYDNIFKPYAGVGMWLITVVLLVGWGQMERLNDESDKELAAFAQVRAQLTILESFDERNDPAMLNTLHELKEQVRILADEGLVKGTVGDVFSANRHEAIYTFTANNGQSTRRLIQVLDDHIKTGEARAHTFTLRRSFFRTGAGLSFLVTSLWCFVFVTKGIWYPLGQIVRRLNNEGEAVRTSGVALPVRQLAAQVERVCSFQEDALLAIAGMARESKDRIQLAHDNPFAPSVAQISKRLQSNKIILNVPVMRW